METKSQPEVDIPDKLYFRIGEVSRLIGVKQYVLRYWETEFPSLTPRKSGSNHRLYRRKDVELLLEIKRLLYEKRYTIEGARNLLENRPRETAKTATAKASRIKTAAAPAQTPGQGLLFHPASDLLNNIRKELVAILDMLK